MRKSSIRLPSHPPMKPLLLLALLLLTAASAALAADSTFSLDNKHAYLLPDAGAQLIDIDLAKKTFTRIDLSKSIPAPIQALSLSNAGFILCASAQAIWSYDPKTSVTRKICDAPNSVTLSDIAYDPSSGQILAVGHAANASQSLLCLDKNGSALKQIYARYGATVSFPVFSADGDLFFVDRGDLWTGFIERDDDAGGGPARTLVAYRCAPIAHLIEENTSPASTGLHHIAVTAHSIYAQYSRMSGSGWGSTIHFIRPPRLPSSASQGREEPPVNPQGWATFKPILSSIQEIGASNLCNFLCASHDQSLVLLAYPYTGSDKLLLIRNATPPQPIEIKGLANAFNGH